jgi:hypothetical protein
MRGAILRLLGSVDAVVKQFITAPGDDVIGDLISVKCTEHAALRGARCSRARLSNQEAYVTNGTQKLRMQIKPKGHSVSRAGLTVSSDCEDVGYRCVN